MSEPRKTEKKQPETPSSKTEALCIDFHGAAIIDDNGVEIPITEEMVKHACQQVEQKKS